MVGLKLVPLSVLAVLILLAIAGAEGQAFNQPRHVTCAYRLAEFDAPAADVLIVGSSRVGRGLDPGYMMSHLAETYGKSVVVERLGMTFPHVAQFRPPIAKYIQERGAPKYVFLQLLYTARAPQIRTVDTPINPLRNVANASLGELIEIQSGAVMNAYETRLPRTYESDYTSIPAMVLQKLETYIYAALRYPGQKLLGNLEMCKGKKLFNQNHRKWLFESIDDSVTFEQTEKQKKEFEKYLRNVEGFLSFDASKPYRAFENAQLHALINKLESAGSTVFLMVMPALGQKSISDAELAGIKSAFPDNPLLHPYSLYQTEIGEKLAVSFSDTHHATHYGALQFSRYYASEIAKLPF